MIFLYTLILSVVITVLFVPVCTEFAIMFYVMDRPGEGNSLKYPMPKIGGIAIALGSIIPILIWNHEPRMIHAFIISACVVVLFGIVEDFRGLPPKGKLVGQILAAIIIVWYGGVQIRGLGSLLPNDFILPLWLSIPITTAVIVGAINTVKLSDGLAGLAAGTYILILTGIGYLAYLNGKDNIGLVCVALCGALFGFLRFNTHPASIFMGNSGSQFLGFSACTFAIATTQGHSNPLSPVLPIILLGFPILNTLTVVANRISSRRSLLVADQNNVHNYLISYGFSHSVSVLIIYAFQTLLLFAAVYFRFYSDWSLLSGYLLFSTLILFCFFNADWIIRKLICFDLFNIKIVGPIRLLRKNGTVIKWMFPLTEICITLLLIVTCMLANSYPQYIKISSGVIACFILIALLVKSKFLGWLLRVSVYLLVPFAVYFSSETLSNTGDVLVKVYNLSFGIFAVLIIMVSKLSQRKQGFQSNPLDFIIVILVLLVPNLLGYKVHDYLIGLVAVKTILIYFSFEVLMAELRGKFNKVALAAIASLLIMVLKG